MLVKHCGQLGYVLHRLANGQDDRPVVNGSQPKSVGKEITFDTDIFGLEALKTELWALGEKVGWRLRRQGLSGKTVTVKIRFGSFRTITRSRTLSVATNLDETICRTAADILAGVTLNEGVRLLGVTVSGLEKGGGQISLFGQDDEKITAVAMAIDKVKEKFGEGAVTRGRSLLSQYR